MSRLMKGIDKPKKSGPQVYDEPKNSIPIPLNPMGMPKVRPRVFAPRPPALLTLLFLLDSVPSAQYDGGERFDLKAPYCDEGYVDEDAVSTMPHHTPGPGRANPCRCEGLESNRSDIELTLFDFVICFQKTRRT